MPTKNEWSGPKGQHISKSNQNELAKRKISSSNMPWQKGQCYYLDIISSQVSPQKKRSSHGQLKIPTAFPHEFSHGSQLQPDGPPWVAVLNSRSSASTSWPRHFLDLNGWSIVSCGAYGGNWCKCLPYQAYQARYSEKRHVPPSKWLST